MTDKKMTQVVTDEQAGMRLDQFLTLGFTQADLSRSQFQRLLKDGQVMVNGGLLRSKYIVRQGDEISVVLPGIVESAVLAQYIPLDIVFEDEEILVINKQTDLVVHPGAGNPDLTLVNALLHHCGDSLPGIHGEKRPGIVHRLDKQTSGCMVVAKTQNAFEDLQQQIQNHTAGRIYVALAWGRFEEEHGEIDAPLGRSPRDRKKMAVVFDGGRDARTHFIVRERFARASQLEIKLETGRTHQIRVHLHSIGHPVVQDSDYGKIPSGVSGEVRQKLNTVLKRQALHAWKLQLRHPKSGADMEFMAPVPLDIQQAQEILQADL